MYPCQVNSAATEKTPCIPLWNLFTTLYGSLLYRRTIVARDVRRGEWRSQRYTQKLENQLPTVWFDTISYQSRL